MAINLCRSPRVPSFITGPDSIGPGVYETDVRHAVEPSPAPFQSMQEKFHQDRSTYVMTPGPGFYRVQTALHDSGTTHGFKSTSARIAPQTPGSTQFCHSSLQDNPGPGSYYTAKIWVKQKPTAPRKGTPVLDLCKTAASIPNRTNDDQEGGEKRDDKKGSLPGQDDLLAKTPKTTGLQEKRRKRGTNFHSSEGKRNMFKHSCAIENTQPAPEAPGPGAYRVEQSISAKGARNAFVSRTPMCHQRTREDKPDFSLEADLSLSIGEGAGAEHTFQSQVERIGWYRSLQHPFTEAFSQVVPGPGHYHSAGEVDQKKIHRVHNPTAITALNDAEGPHHAFNTKDVRSCNKDSAKEDVPPPGHYNLEMTGSTLASVLQGKALIGKKGVFGSTADRFFRSAFDIALVSSTGKEDFRDYDPVSTTREPSRRSMFQSGLKRFADDRPKTGSLPIETPGPTHYTPETDINYRSPFRHPRHEHLSFGSGTTRFNPNEIIQGIQHELRPGPGEYESLDNRRIATACGGARSKRKLTGCVGSTTTGVGPGTYEIGGTMLKKSFNVT